MPAAAARARGHAVYAEAREWTIVPTVPAISVTVVAARVARNVAAKESDLIINYQ